MYIFILFAIIALLLQYGLDPLYLVVGTVIILVAYILKHKEE